MMTSRVWLLAAIGIAGAGVLSAFAQEKKQEPLPIPTTSTPDLKFPPGAVKPNLPADFQPYIESIPGTNLKFMMIPIPGGEYTMGSPDTEAERQDNEGPQIKVRVEPFWMAACEVTWDEYDQFSFSYDIKAAKEQSKSGVPAVRTQNDVLADAVTRPTPPYVDMTFGKGHDRFPASCMTAHAAIHYCAWLAAKTGRPYRLPSEAEWEFAARAGTKTAYSFGNSPDKIDEYAWHADDSEEKPHPVMQKKPNAWGLFDMHGNVREWTLDEYHEDYFKKFNPASLNVSPTIPAPVTTKAKHIWHSARGGSWMDDKSWCRSAWRIGAEEDWSQQDPQLPKSIWWHTDAQHTGFRVIRPYKPGSTGAVIPSEALKGPPKPTTSTPSPK